METGNKVGLGMVGVGVVGGGYEAARAVGSAKKVAAATIEAMPKLDAATAAKLNDSPVEGAFQRAMEGSDQAKQAATEIVSQYFKDTGVTKDVVAIVGHSGGAMALGGLAAIGGVVLLAKAIF